MGRVVPNFWEHLGRRQRAGRHVQHALDFFVHLSHFDCKSQLQHMLNMASAKPGKECCLLVLSCKLGSMSTASASPKAFAH